MHRPHVGQVADVAVEERAPAGRVDGLEHDRRAGPHASAASFEAPHQVVGLQVLDHLGGDEAAEAVGVGRGQEAGTSVSATSKPLARQRSTISMVQVDAAGRDAGVAQQPEELAAAAADVDDVARRREKPRRSRAIRSRMSSSAAAIGVLEADVLLAAQRIGGQHLLRYPGRRPAMAPTLRPCPAPTPMPRESGPLAARSSCRSQRRCRLLLTGPRAVRDSSSAQSPAAGRG